MRANEDGAKEVGVLEYAAAKLQRTEVDSLTLDWATLLQTYCQATATVDIFDKDERLEGDTDVTKILPQDPTQWEDVISSVDTAADRFNREYTYGAKTVLHGSSLHTEFGQTHFWG